MHPSLARALQHPFMIFFVDPTVREEKKKKRKKKEKNVSSTSQRRRRSQDDQCQRFFSAAPAMYLSGRLLFRSWGPPSLRSRVPLFARRMHFCPERKKPGGRDKDITRPVQLLTLAGEGPLTKGGGARFFGLARGSSS